MRMMTRTAGLELAKNGIHMVNVGPGAVATPINDLSFEGWADFIDAKGKDESGTNTKAETHIYATLMYDVSPALGAAKNTFKLGAGYEYWKNKFGNDNSLVANKGGAFAKTPFIKAEYHF